MASWTNAEASSAATARRERDKRAGDKSCRTTQVCIRRSLRLCALRGCRFLFRVGFPFLLGFVTLYILIYLRFVNGFGARLNLNNFHRKHDAAPLHTWR